MFLDLAFSRVPHVNLYECLAGRNTVTNREDDHDKQKSHKKDGPMPATDNYHGSSPGTISGAPSGMFSSKRKFKLLIFIMVLVSIRTVMVLSMDCTIR